jgi:hypothetical protein
MSPKKRSTSPSSKNISIGKDVVDSVLITGDHNVVNYFKGEYVSLKEHYVPPDSVFQRVRTEDFVGRDWLTVQVDAFLNDPQRKSGAFLLIGDAGVGKTSFMAHLVKERNYLHLFAEQVPGQAMLQRAIQSLGSQLVTRYQIDPYKDRDTLIQGTVFPDFLERLLRMAASKLTGGEKIVIVCDALDEAGTFPDGNVFGLPNVLPDGVYLILSQRPVNVKLPNLEPLTVRLEAQGADNLGDMEKYLRVVAQRASVADQIRAKNYSDAFFIQTLKEKSLGVWMYLHYVIKEIENGSRAPLELEALPTGLVGYYADFWGDWRMGRKGRGQGEQAWNALYAPLLATLAAAQEAIPIGTLIQWAGVNADEDEVTRLVAEEWRAFIEEKEAGAEMRYKPYHLSFADFIAGRADHEKLPPAQKYLVRDLAKRTVKAHQRIVQVFESECNGQWDRLVEREYPRLHLSAHLNGAGEFETLRILLTEGEEKIKWAEAREQKEETYAGYLNDLTYVWTYAEREQNYALAIRCMLTENSIHSLATNIPPELLAELAKAGIWSYARCLSIIRQKLKPDDQVKSLESLASGLPATLFQEAFNIARAIENEHDRARALSNLAPYFNEEFKKNVLLAASEIQDEYAYAGVLSNLAPVLNNDLKQEICFAAYKIKNKIIQARVLYTLIPHLNDEQKEQVLQNAFFSISEIQDENNRVDALIAIAPQFNEQLKAQALSVICKIKDEHFRVRALSALVARLSEELKKQVLLAIKEVQNERLRARALSTAARYFNEELKGQTLSTIYDIKDEHIRFRAINDLLPLLNDDLKAQALSAVGGIRNLYFSADTPNFNTAINAQVFDAAYNIVEQHTFISVLPASLADLNEEQKAQALQKALSIVREIKSEITRARSFVAITRHLTEDVKVQILQEAVAVTHKISDEFFHASALIDIAQYLKENLKTEALQRALSAANEVQDDDSIFRVLVALAPHLNDQLEKQALSIAYKVKDAFLSVKSFLVLTLSLSEELKKKVIQEAFSVVCEIKKESVRAEAISTIVPYLNEDQKMQILSTMSEFGNESIRADILSALSPHLSKNLECQALSVALAIKDEYDCISALSNLTPYLTEQLKDQSFQRILNITHRIDETVCARALSVLAPHLNDKLRKQALSTAHKIKDEFARAHALAVLVPYLQGKIKDQTLLSIHNIKSESARARALSTLIPHLNEELKTQSLQEGISAAHKIKDVFLRANTLTTLLPYLKQKIKKQTLQEVLSAMHEIKNESDRANILINLAPNITEDLKIQALSAIREIKDEQLHAHTLTALVSYLNNENQIAVLQELLYVPNSFLLRKALNTWKAIGFKDIKRNIFSFFKLMSQKNRKDGVEIIGILTPALVHLSGEEIVPELYRAIQDVTRWWP